MSLFAVLSVDDTFRARLGAALEEHHDLAGVVKWGGLCRVVRERPVSAVIVDSERLVHGPNADPASAIQQLAKLRRDFPSVGSIVVARRETQGEVLFHLGCAGLPDLRLVLMNELDYRLGKEVTQALRWSAPARVTQALAPHLAHRDLVVMRRLVDSLHRRYSADVFARTVGMHRPQLSKRLVNSGLPSVGRLILWGRLFQAAVWLVEPGRTAESVSRQLEYSSGAAFRRALRLRLGVTPTDLVEAGGLPFVLDQFRQACTEERSLMAVRAG